MRVFKFPDAPDFVPRLCLVSADEFEPFIVPDDYQYKNGEMLVPIKGLDIQLEGWPRIAIPEAWWWRYHVKAYAARSYNKVLSVCDISDVVLAEILQANGAIFVVGHHSESAA